MIPGTRQIMDKIATRKHRGSINYQQASKLIKDLWQANKNVRASITDKSNGSPALFAGPGKSSPLFSKQQLADLSRRLASRGTSVEGKAKTSFQRYRNVFHTARTKPTGPTSSPRKVRPQFRNVSRSDSNDIVRPRRKGNPRRNPGGSRSRTQGRRFNRNKNHKYKAGPKSAGTRSSALGFTRTRSALGAESTTAVPTSFSLVQRGGHAALADATCYSPTLGLRGTLIRGNQPFQTITGNAATSSLTTNNTLATALTANLIELSPDTFNSVCAARSQAYEKYCIRKLAFRYTPVRTISYTGAIAMSVTPDSDQADAPASFDEVRLTDGFEVFSKHDFNSAATYMEYAYHGNETWFNSAIAAAGTADKRQTTQGMMAIWPDGVNSASEIVGYLDMYYEIELYSQSAIQTISTFIATDYERHLVKAFLARLRLNNGGKKTHCLADCLPHDKTSSTIPVVTYTEDLSQIFHEEYSVIPSTAGKVTLPKK